LGKLFVALLAAAVVSTVAPAAHAADVGANDDTGKFAADGGHTFYGRMAALGLRQTILTVRWRPSEPEAIHHAEFLDRAVPAATAHGIRVVFAVYPYPPRELASGLATPTGFAAYLTRLAERYPDVRQYVVGNEPNQPAFWRPQLRPGTGKVLSAARFGTFLAAGYDALKAVDPTIAVVGVGLSPRGNDNAAARSNVSTSPARFLAALGAWYRRSGRTEPLMDGLSYHPYPWSATDGPSRSYAWPNAGFADLARIKQALWDAFAGTGQPTTVEGLRLYLDEVGWQVDTTAGLHRARERAHDRRAPAGGDLRTARPRDRVRRRRRAAQFLRLLRRRRPRQRLPVGSAPARRHSTGLGWSGGGGDPGNRGGLPRQTGPLASRQDPERR
jgi:hypothetical protein